jgi:hypothetical protein
VKSTEKEKKHEKVESYVETRHASASPKKIFIFFSDVRKKRLPLQTKKNTHKKCRIKVFIFKNKRERVL